MTIPDCPHCGAREHIYANAQARGRVATWFDHDGSHVEWSTDDLRFEFFSDVLRCGKCNKIRRDVEWDPGKRSAIRLVIDK